MIRSKKSELSTQKNRTKTGLDKVMTMFSCLPLGMPDACTSCIYHAMSTVWWKVLMAFLHNRAAESHEILSECSHQ